MIFAPFSLLKSCSSVFCSGNDQSYTLGEEQIRSRGQKTPSLPAILILEAFLGGGVLIPLSFSLSLSLSLFHMLGLGGKCVVGRGVIFCQISYVCSRIC